MDTTEPIVFGAGYSVYVRAVRLALVEKGVPYRLVEVDIFADEIPAAYLERQPFKRIPAFEHGAFRLYEAGAIVRYIDNAFVGPELMSRDPQPRARADQIMSVIDNYVYRPLVRDIYVERCLRPIEGRPTDEAKIAAALPLAQTCLGALEELADEPGPYLTGDDLSLADVMFAPMAVYFMQAPEVAEMLSRFPRLDRWWTHLRDRPSLRAVAGTRVR